uniref:MIP29004p n=1 Tax=Drosophila melanogaster TaxID=7227 RepID=E8NH44_DROME|nr:MIP29004p [Drosophila melanogaster]
MPSTTPLPIRLWCPELEHSRCARTTSWSPSRTPSRASPAWQCRPLPMPCWSFPRRWP